ncbi:MAG: hypothetical protein CENE_02556 [Candidatus Celerinatantimonas neptuna]|nr:MAG: hypothetical protein CENE_02556 [Candidatus Celerinatantimonas neptuna]
MFSKKLICSLVAVTVLGCSSFSANALTLKLSHNLSRQHPINKALQFMAKEAKLSIKQHRENIKQRLFDLSDINDPEFDGYLFNSIPLTSEN